MVVGYGYEENRGETHRKPDKPTNTNITWGNHRENVMVIGKIIDYSSTLSFGNSSALETVCWHHLLFSAISC